MRADCMFLKKQTVIYGFRIPGCKHLRDAGINNAFKFLIVSRIHLLLSRFLNSADIDKIGSEIFLLAKINNDIDDLSIAHFESHSRPKGRIRSSHIAGFRRT